MLDFGYYNMDCMQGMKEVPDKFFDLWDFNLNKLEGIQHGIKVFKNMSMKEIIEGIKDFVPVGMRQAAVRFRL